MRDRFPLVVMGVMLFAAFTFAFIQRGAARGTFADVLSTYRSEPNGARALYLLAAESGVAVDRVRTAFTTPDEGASWVLLGVESSAAHVFTLDAGSDDTEHQLAERMFQRASVLDPKERKALLDRVARGRNILYVPSYARENAFLSELNVGMTPADEKAGMRTLVPAQPSPYTVGVHRLETEVTGYLTLPEDATPLLVDAFDLRVVAASIPWKQGRVIVLGAPGLAMNQALARCDNARFWLNTLRTVAGSGKVEFDEFHHGFTDDRSVAEFARHYGLHFAGLQLLLGLALWGGSLRRFGKPRGAIEDERVGATDALFAQSRLYREGRHRKHAATRITGLLAEDLAHLGGLPPKSEAPAIAAAFRARGRPDVARAFLRLHQDAKTTTSEADVLRIAQAAARLRQRKDV